MDVGAHGVDGGREFTQLIGAVRVLDRDGLRKVARAKTQSPRTDVIQRPQHAPHAGIGYRGEQQQNAQRGPADEARPVVPDLHIEAEADMVPIGQGALKKAGAIGGPARFALRVVIGFAGVAAPVDRGAADAHAHGQPLGDGACTLHVGRGANFGGEPVDIVHHQRTRRITPANAQRVLHAKHEGCRHGQSQQQEHGHQPHAQRVGQRVARAAMPVGLCPHASRCAWFAAPRGGLRALGRPGGAHACRRTSARV